MGFALGGKPATTSVKPTELCHNVCVQHVDADYDGSCSKSQCVEIWAPDGTDPAGWVRTDSEYVVVCALATTMVVVFVARKNARVHR